MPRANRQISKTKVYHIIIRGIDKQDIFFFERDYYKFLKIIKEVKKDYNFDIYAYCLMTNHVHMVIYDKEEQFSKIMQIIEIKYVKYFNKKYERTGHLFQNRFLSKQIENREYLKIVCRYIHQNPAKAGICKTEDYKWSSYNEYLDKNIIINSKMLLRIFSENENEARKEFIKYHSNELNKKIYELFEFEFEDRLSDEQLIEYVCEYFKMSLTEIKLLLKVDKERGKGIIKKCKQFKGISNRQWSRVLGINRKMLDRI